MVERKARHMIMTMIWVLAKTYDKIVKKEGSKKEKVLTASREE